MRTKAEIVIRFRAERNTRNKTRFREVLAHDEDSPVAEFLYLDRDVVEAMGNPKLIEVSIKPEKEVA